MEEVIGGAPEEAPRPRVLPPQFRPEVLDKLQPMPHVAVREAARNRIGGSPLQQSWDQSSDFARMLMTIADDPKIVLARRHELVEQLTRACAVRLGSFAAISRLGLDHRIAGAAGALSRVNPHEAAAFMATGCSSVACYGIPVVELLAAAIRGCHPCVPAGWKVPDEPEAQAQPQEPRPGVR